MCTALGSVSGRFTAATCLIQISRSQKSLRRSSARCIDLDLMVFFSMDFYTNGDVLQNLRPEIPRCCPSSVGNVMKKCWDGNPEKRPEMDEVVRILEGIDTTKGGGMIPEDHCHQRCFCFGQRRGP